MGDRQNLDASPRPDVADAVAAAKQERLDNAVDELVSAKEAGAPGRARDRASQAEARQTSDDTLAAEYAEATSGGEDRPPLIVDGPGEQPLVRADPAVPPAVHATMEVAAKAADMHGGAPVATAVLKGLGNAADAASLDGVRAKVSYFTAATLIDTSVVPATADGADLTSDTAVDDVKASAKTVSEARFGEAPPADDEQGPLVS